jgi:hypothetical protein
MSVQKGFSWGCGIYLGVACAAVVLPLLLCAGLLGLGSLAPRAREQARKNEERQELKAKAAEQNARAEQRYPERARRPPAATPAPKTPEPSAERLHEEIEKVALPPTFPDKPPAKKPPTPELRTWKNVRGELIAEATFAGAIGQKVRLKTATGELLTVPITELSAADREWIRGRR